MEINRLNEKCFSCLPLQYDLDIVKYDGVKKEKERVPAKDPVLPPYTRHALAWDIILPSEEAWCFQGISMIRKNLINCKLFREKRSGKSIYAECMDHLCPQDEPCPCCGRTGCLRVHAYYGRTLIDLVDGRPVKIILCICRLICIACARASTHAILPDPVIPYCRHSLRFILRVLAEHVLRLRPVEKICEAFKITVRTFYRWKKVFEEHRKEWQTLFLTAQMDLKASLLNILHKDPFSTFAASFFRQAGSSFLQSHKNPICPSRKDGPAPVSLTTTRHGHGQGQDIRL